MPTLPTRGESHQRKVQSYHVEAAFYSKDGPAVSLVNAGVHVPTPFATAVSVASDNAGGVDGTRTKATARGGTEGGTEMEFLLSDLRVTHPRRFSRGSFEEAVAGRVGTRTPGGCQIGL